MQVLKELDDMELRVSGVVEAIDEMAALLGDGEKVGRLREAAIGLEKATEGISWGWTDLGRGEQVVCNSD